MKKTFTLLFILYFCIRLSVSGAYFHFQKKLAFSNPDTSAIKQRQDSAKTSTPQNQGIKLITDLLIKDNTIFVIPVNGGDSFKLPLSALHPDSAIVLTTDSTKIDLKLSTLLAKKDSVSAAAPINNDDGLKRITSEIELDSLRSTVILAQMHTDSLRQQIRLKQQAYIANLLKVNDPDSIKNELKHSMNDTVKASLYTHLAGFYLNYDTISNKRKQAAYQNEAINFTLLAIQRYASYNDTTGLRLSFDNLTKVYYSQKKYTQAKWFILQSNTLSRAKNDTANIILSLLTLSTIKSEIKDYDLAMRDLNEALQLSRTTHSQKKELQVLKYYALLYSRLKNYPKEALMLKKRDSLQESMRKAEEAQLAANALKMKKLDSVQNKKKVYSSNTRKLYKNNSAKKIVSL